MTQRQAPRFADGRCITCGQSRCVCPEPLRWYQKLALALLVLAVIGVCTAVWVAYNVAVYDDWRCAFAHCVKVKLP